MQPAWQAQPRCVRLAVPHCKNATLSKDMSTPKKAASGTAAVSSTPFLRVGESGIHGLGAFATRSLPASTFLGFYDGRRYTPAQIAAKD